MRSCRFVRNGTPDANSSWSEPRRGVWLFIHARHGEGEPAGPPTPTDRWTRRAGGAGVTATRRRQACPRGDANGWRLLAAAALVRVRVRGAPTGPAAPRRTTDKRSRPRTTPPPTRAYLGACTSASACRGGLARAAPFRHPSRAASATLSAPGASAPRGAARRSACVISSRQGVFFGGFRGLFFLGGFVSACVEG